jgi:hypothetical protein
MTAAHWNLTRLCFLTFGLLATGCAELIQHRQRWLDEKAPQPAPPLQIPSPPVDDPSASKAIDVALGKEPAPPMPAKPSEKTPSPGPANPSITQVKGETQLSTAATLRALYEKAAQRYQTMESYMMRLRRREVVGGKARPEELMLVKFRQEPWSVYFKWIGPEAKGREVVYVKGRPGNEIHTLTAAGDVLLLPAGQRFSISADSVLVKSKSRYPITEAGLGSSIHKFGSLVEAVEKGDERQGTVKYLGRVKRAEFEEPVEGVEQTVPPESDPHLPKGGKRWWYFDTTLGMPVLIVTHDETGREVEYYCHDHIQSPVRLDDDDFNPDKLWPKKTQ